MTPPDQRTCQVCGSSLPNESLGGRCPNCLLQLALTPPPEELAGETPVMTGRELTQERRFFCGYELCSEISRGGMGVVYHAHQFSPDRDVALKMIHPAGQATPAARMRFQVEVAAVARLHHPHIVSLYESGEHEGVCYYSMRLVEGQGLDDWLREHSPGPNLQEKVELLIKVAEAIQYAHDRGILHRDLKPSNILIDRDGEPCIADFGLAKIQEQDAGITLDRSVLGSPGYMSPEQAAGDGAEITTLADVYSLGAVLYELLTGKPPFVAGTALETLRKVQEDTPVRPRLLQPGLPRDLESICLKAIEKNPRQRYASAQALADDLRCWRDGEPVQARPVAPLAQAWRWCRRRPAWAALILVTLVMLIGLTIGSSLVARRLKVAGEATDRLVHRLQHEKAEAFLEKGETGKGLAMLAYLLREDPSDEVVGARLMSALAHRPIAIPTIRPWVGGAPILAAGFSSDGRYSFSVAQNGNFRRVEMASARTWDARLTEGDRSLLFAGINDSNNLFLAAHADGSVSVHSPENPVSPVTVLRHEVSVIQATFLAEESSVVTVDRRNIIRHWQPAGDGSTGWTSSVVDFLDDPSITVMARHPNSNSIVVGTASGGVHLVSMVNGPSNQALVELTNTIQTVAFDRSGSRIAAASSLGAVVVVHFEESGNRLTRMSMRMSPTDLEFSPDGRLLVGCGWSKVDGASIWDTDTGELVSDAPRHNSHLTTVRFRPDGRELVTLGHDNTARRWEVGAWTEIGEPMVHQTPPQHVAFSSNGRDLVTGSFTGSVWWDVSPVDSRDGLLEQGSSITQVALSPDRSALAVTTVDPGLHLRDAGDGALRFSVKGLSRRLYYITYNGQGDLIAGLDAHGVIRFWSAHNGETAAPAIDTGTEVRGMAFEHNGNRMWTGGIDGLVRCWEVTAGRMVLPPLEHGAELRGLVLHPDGKLVVSYGQDSRLVLWSTESGERLRAPLVASNNPQLARFSSSGKWLAAGGEGNDVSVWRTADDWVRTVPLKHQNEVNTIAFSPDEQFLASGSVDRTAMVHALGQEGVEPLLLPHASSVVWAEFSRDNRMLLTMTQEGFARLWDPESGMPMTEPMQHAPSQFARAYFDRGENRILAYGGNQKVSYWRIPRYRAENAEPLIVVAELVGRIKMEDANRFIVSPLHDWEKLTTPFDRSMLLNADLR